MKLVLWYSTYNFFDKTCLVQLSTISVKSQAKHDNKPPDTSLGRFYGLDRSYHATNVNFKEKLDEKREEAYVNPVYSCQSTPRSKNKI